jgi:hypothetical protein
VGGPSKKVWLSLRRPTGRIKSRDPLGGTPAFSYSKIRLRVQLNLVHSAQKKVHHVNRKLWVQNKVQEFLCIQSPVGQNMLTRKFDQN